MFKLNMVSAAHRAQKKEHQDLCLLVLSLFSCRGRRAEETSPLAKGICPDSAALACLSNYWGHVSFPIVKVMSALRQGVYPWQQTAFLGQADRVILWPTVRESTYFCTKHPWEIFTEGIMRKCSSKTIRVIKQMPRKMTTMRYQQIGQLHI